MNSSILVGILTGTSAVIGWFAGRKKYKAEVDKDISETKKNEEDIREARITQLSTSIDIYEKVFKELKEQMTVLTKKCSELTTKCIDLSTEISELRTENKDLKKQIHELNSRLQNKKK